MERIVAYNIKLDFENNEVFGCKTLKLSAGEIYPLLGENGTGKSSFLRLISGIINPSEGNIKVYGKVIYQPQKPAVFNISVMENALIGIKGKERDRAMNLLNRAGIGHLADKNAKKLSAGEKQRLCFVRTLMANGDIILLDEPFSAIDEKSAGIFEQILREHKEEGKTILIATHSYESAKRLSDKYILIGDREMKLCYM